MSDDEQQKHFAAALEGLDQWSALLDMMEGYVQAAIARGYTDEHARALVIHSFIRPPS